jgi:tRNA-Thr(GGU) m(6)t(6)A37 methyltransferase TsaA
MLRWVRACACRKCARVRHEYPLVDPETAPKQGPEGSPDASVVFDPSVTEALRDVRPGEEYILITWLDRARRDVLVVHPRDDPLKPERGVFSTRSSHRPNPIGLHRVRIAGVDGLEIRVRNLEALDGTPVLDLKPVLDAADRSGPRRARTTDKPPLGNLNAERGASKQARRVVCWPSDFLLG